jgi:hypothetical protein
MIDVIDCAWRDRAFIGLSQGEACVSTGIPVYKLRKFESGIGKFHDCEPLRNFLRLRLVLEEIAHSNGSDPERSLSTEGDQLKRRWPVRWVKHLSMAHADEEIDRLCQAHGPAGYGIWWFIIEDIASAMDGAKAEPSAEHSLLRWAEVCYTNTQKFKNVLSYLTPHLVKAEWMNTGSRARRDTNRRATRGQPKNNPSPTREERVRNPRGTRLKLTVPNILKYRDEYSRKSGVTPDNVAPKSESDQSQSRNRERSRAEVREAEVLARSRETKISKPAQRRKPFFSTTDADLSDKNQEANHDDAAFPVGSRSRPVPGRNARRRSLH